MPNKKAKIDNQRSIKLLYDFEKYKYTFPQEDKTQQSNNVLIIDNGAFRTRVGWSNDLFPKMSFPPAVASTKVKSHSLILVGNNLRNQLPVNSNDINTPFSKNIVCDFSLMENILDYTFDNFINDQKSLDQPVLITETFSNPSRTCFIFYNRIIIII